MKHSIITIQLFLLIFIAACSSQKYTPSDYPEAQIRFGSGGGIAGIETTYSLLGNGKIFVSKDTDQEFEALAKVSKKKYASLLAKCQEMGMEKMKHQEPGNLYQFIEIGQTGALNRISWGEKAPDGVDALYKELQTLIKK